MIKTSILLTLFLFIFSACSDKTISLTSDSLPTAKIKDNINITLFSLNNYTDTPRAGMRAANIAEGILSSRGYKVYFYNKETTQKDRGAIAKQQNSKYYMSGAVSEWRYKTGIDGEPAVSIRLALYNTKTDRLVWSGVGANNDWGNGSIGTTAQSLIEEMFQ